jgi:hypothetical protein
MEESVEIGVITGEFPRSLGKHETDGFDVHGEGGIMVGRGFDWTT